MKFFRELIKTSRPRFWMYTFGPFLVGIAASGVWPEQLPVGLLTILAIYFLFPANLLIYGTNDVFDSDTDFFNEKKLGYESQLSDGSRRSTIASILLTNIPLIMLAVALAPVILLPLVVFLFLSIFYSAPPIRAKSKPFLDSAFNVLYVFPGVVAYHALTGEWPAAYAIVAAGCWTAAMHAYSAIPDIAADRAAGISTIATLMDARATMAVCGMLFAVAAVLSFKYLGYLAVVLGVVYLLLIVVSFRSFRHGRLFEIYRVFPLINSLSGAAIFWYVALSRW